MYNIMFGTEKMSEGIFRLLGMENKNPQTEEEKELCDIGFSRYRDVTVMEECRIVMVTTRTGGGNRLEYKKNIRDIRDHSLYIDDMDWPVDKTYAWWYFRVPDSKREHLQKMCNDHKINVRPLDRDIEKKVLAKLNYPNYVDSESDTDYSDEDDFKYRYGYWYSDDCQSETDDNMSDHEDHENKEDKMMGDESPVEMGVIEKGVSNMDL